MSEAYQNRSSLDINAFTLHEFMVLGVLKEREMCGSEVAMSLSKIGDVGKPVGIGIVYPVLKDLAKEGALSARRTGGKPRVYYSLTDKGKARLRTIANSWATINRSLQSLVEDNMSKVD
jgi:PadR family transcriptional regulator, regulatory protein PadR